MPLTFASAFPRLYALLPFMTLSPHLAWSSAHDWADEQAVIWFAHTVLDRQLLAADHELQWLEDVSDAAIRDLNDLLVRTDDPQARRSIAFLRHMFSVLPMEKAFALGRRGPAYDWAFRGMSDSYDPARRYNAGYTFLPLREAGDPRVGALAMRWLPRWCVTFFLIARDAGMRRGEAATFTPCWDVLLGLLAIDGRGNPVLVNEIYFGLASMASWAVLEDFARTDEWVSWLVDAWKAGRIPRDAASVVATVFITRASPLTGTSSHEWATEVLDRFGDTLREHERLQFLIASIDTRERWLASRDAILAEIAELNERAATVEELGSSALFARDARLDVVKPLIRRLVLDQDLASAMDVLRAWYRRPGTDPCDDNVLLVHPALGDGVAMLWPGRAHINLQTATQGHEIVVDALCDALGIVRDPGVGPVDERREGIPDYADGAQVEAAMLDFYRPSELAGQFRRIGDPRSLVIFPSVSDPLQALLARELDVLLPLEVSLAQARPQRPVRTFSVWAGPTYFTQFEVEALQTLAGERGWTLAIFPGSEDGDADDFRAFYEQEEPDVLWVAGHGEFVAHRPHETGIVVGNPRAERIDGQVTDVILPMETVAGFGVPGDDRRLLVLNTCNGATTQGMAGMARIGLAQSLVQPTQAVIGHLWPASSALGLAFGTLFAANLDSGDVTDAFATTLRELRDPDAIVASIEARLGAPFAGAARIESCKADLSSILAWGCPVLLT